MMNGEMKKCPMCAEEINAEARICQYCGARFEVSVKGYCANCHTVVEADEAGKCPRCGSDVVDRHVESTFLEEQAAPPPQPAPPIPPPPSGPGRILEVWERKGEGVGNRWAAIFLDQFVIYFLYIVAVIAFAAFTTGITRITDTSSREALLNLFLGTTLLLLPAIWFLYFFVMEGTVGATVGKALVGLKVVQPDGARCGYGRAAIRALSGLFETNLLGAIVIWVTRQHQRIGDLLAGTLVVHTKKLLTVTLLSDRAAFEFADGRRVEIGQLIHGTVYNWGQLHEIKLDGVTPAGQRVRLKIPIFPSEHKREQVWNELERFFRVTFAERRQWWRLVVGLAAAAIGVLGVVGILVLPSLGRLPALPRIGPTPTAAPTALMVLAKPTPPLKPTTTRRSATPTPVRTPTRTPAPSSPGSCPPNAAFVTDVTIPDGTQFAPGEAFSKVWRVRSSGCAPWEPGTRWAFVSGDQMSAPDSVDVPETSPGETTDLSVSMQAPGQPGTYKGYWQMQGPDGRHFGDQAYVLIAVGTAEVAPTPAAGVGTGTAQGRVLWNEQPFAGVTVKLCADWGMFGGCKGTEYQAVTDTDGRYTITGIPPGEYDFVTKLPDQPNETGWLGLSVTVQADQTVTVRDVPVVKYDLKLLSPADKTTVNTTTPALTWESYPGAAYYKVYVSGGPSSKTVVSFEKTTATQYNVTTPLESGEYHWRITAYNASGSEIAENGRLSYFTVAP